jgi:hypothetical protein
MQVPASDFYWNYNSKTHFGTIFNNSLPVSFTYGSQDGYMKSLNVEIRENKKLQYYCRL